MKKILAIVAILALVSGCAFVQKVRDNFLPVVQKTLCNPTADQISDAVKALEFLRDRPALATTIAVFDAIRQRICVTLPQLQAALADFDSAAKVAEGQAAVQVMAKKAGAITVPPPLTALRAAAKKGV